MKYLRQIKALSFIRLKLLWNTIFTKAGLGKMVGMGFAAVIMIIATSAAASDLLEVIFKLPYSNLLASWAVGIVVIFSIFVVFTGDLVSGHTLNTGQMSSDYHYLSTLPISAPILIFIKLFERIITDYFGILFLLPVLVGISCYRAYTINAFLAGFLIYAEIGLTTGLLINLVMILLTRFFKASAINNFFSIFGYASALLTLIPVLLFSEFKPSYIPKILEIIDYINEYASWIVAPMHWIATPLLSSTPFCEEFLKFSILWFAITIILTTVFYFAIKNNWASHVHTNKKVKAYKQIKLFSGLLYKEFLMLKSDFNLLVNAVIMPVSIILTEMYFLKKVFSFTSVYSVMNFIFGSIIYFSMFGPINSIGYEGKSITLLETMPILPRKLLQKKFIFWCILALAIFIPSTITTFWLINFDVATTFNALLYIIAFTSSAVWLCISISAIFAKYDTNVLQQRSSFAGKMSALFLLSMLLYIKDVSWINTYTVSVFLLVSYLCYIKAQACLAFRQDKSALSSDTNLTINTAILFMSFVALETSIAQFFKTLIPDVDTGLWNWYLTLVIMLPFVIINRKNNCPILPKFNNAVKVFLTVVINFSITYLYFNLCPNIYEKLILNFQQIAVFGKNFLIPSSLCSLAVLITTTFIMVAFARRADEFFVSNRSKMIKFLGCLLVTLIAPPGIIPPVMLYMLTTFSLNLNKHQEGLCFYSAFPYFTALFWYLIY